MNIEDTQNAIEVMQGYYEGKEIECKPANTNEKWRSLGDGEPFWDWVSYEYRIKPEATIRRFITVDELFADAIKHSGWIKSKGGKYEHIGYVYQGQNRVQIQTIAGCMDSEYMLENYVWADDGSPCGVMEDNL